jgi:hypothetical protein
LPEQSSVDADEGAKAKETMSLQLGDFAQPSNTSQIVELAFFETARSNSPLIGVQVILGPCEEA